MDVNMRKKILLTNYVLKAYTGSELDTVEAANWFFKQGFDVDLFTLEYHELLTKELTADIHIATVGNTDQLLPHYDIIWSHHSDLLDYVLFKLNITAKKVLFHSLSPFEALERPPYYAKELSLLCANTEEIRKTLCVQTGMGTDEIDILPNYAKKEYFEEDVREISQIQKICVVSNHIPEELYQFVELAKGKGYMVDIIGTGHKVVRVDENQLRPYDAIISIGRTIFYTIAMGIPSYCYDRFGGVGFVTENNIADASSENFSGRTYGMRKTPQEIMYDFEQPLPSRKERLRIRSYASQNFSFENNIQRILNKLENSKGVDLEKIKINYSLNVARAGAIIPFYAHCQDLQNTVNALRQEASCYTQVFYDTGNGFSEEQSDISSHPYGKIFDLSIFLKKETVSCRIDPDFEAAFVKAEKCWGIDSEGKYALELETNGKFLDTGILFTDPDPQIVIKNLHSNTSEIHLTLCVEKIPTILAKEFKNLFTTLYQTSRAYMDLSEKFSYSNQVCVDLTNKLNQSNLDCIELTEKLNQSNQKCIDLTKKLSHIFDTNAYKLMKKLRLVP